MRTPDHPSSLLTEPVPHDEGARAISEKPAVTRAIFDQLAPELQARAFVVSGVEALDVVARIRDLTSQLPAGGDFEDLKERIKGELSPWLVTSDDPEERAKEEAAANRRAEMLLRMHGWQAYARSQYELAEAHIDVFPFRQYLTSEDSSVRPHHAALDKKILPADHPFWLTHTPPWEFNCRCDCVVMTADEVEEIQSTEANKTPDEMRVLPPEQLQQIEQQGRIVKPGGTGYLDIRTPRERSGKGYEWRPKDDALSIDQILSRYSPSERKAFEDFAGRQTLDDGRTLLDWWKKSLPAPEGEKQNSQVADPGEGVSGSVVRKSPVSAGVRVRARGEIKDTWETTLDLIDKIHDDGTLPGADALRVPESSNFLGLYDPNPSKRSVQLRAKGSWPHMTAAHELGHYLDHHALGSPGLFATGDLRHPVHEVLGVLKGTATHARLLAEAPPRQRAYWSSDIEMWARAYAQFVAEESGHPDFHADLLKINASPQPWRQWTPAEFAPAREAIRAMFKKKGWMK